MIRWLALLFCPKILARFFSKLLFHYKWLFCEIYNSLEKLGKRGFFQIFSSIGGGDVSCKAEAKSQRPPCFLEFLRMCQILNFLFCSPIKKTWVTKNCFSLLWKRLKKWTEKVWNWQTWPNTNSPWMRYMEVKNSMKLEFNDLYLWETPDSIWRFELIFRDQIYFTKS